MRCRRTFGRRRRWTDKSFHSCCPRGQAKLLRFGIFYAGILVHLMNGGAGNNIVELVAQNSLPAFQKRVRRILLESAAFRRPEHLQPFRFAVEQLQLAVHSFIIGLAGISPPVVLQV